MNRLLCSILLFATLTPVCAQDKSMRIECELGVSATVKSSQAAELVFTLTNTGEDVVHVLNWHTPFEGVRSAMFEVSRDGVDLEYHGPMLKRAAPRATHYFELKPGERKQAKINLADGWNVEAPGKYRVNYTAELFDVVSGATPVPRGLDEFKPFPLRCNPVTFERSR